MELYQCPFLNNYSWNGVNPLYHVHGFHSVERQVDFERRIGTKIVWIEYVITSNPWLLGYDIRKLTTIPNIWWDSDTCHRFTVNNFLPRLVYPLDSIYTCMNSLVRSGLLVFHVWCLLSDTWLCLCSDHTCTSHSLVYDLPSDTQHRVIISY
jgi:hypothetical protein